MERSSGRRVGVGQGRLLTPSVARGAMLVVAGTGLGLVLGGVVPTLTQPPAPVAEALSSPAAAPRPAPTVTVTAPPRVVTRVDVVPDPTRVVIPSLGIDRGLIDLGVAPDGSMEVPSKAAQIGWWAEGPSPGEAGGAVIAAHVELSGKPAAFLELGSMTKGQKIVIDRKDGTRAVYAVATVKQFPKDAFPDDRVYTFDGPTRLHLITCGGVIDERTLHYKDNVVVFADLVSDTRSPQGA